MEKYEGVKFKSIEIYGDVPEKEKLLELDRLLSKFIKTKENEGNMSLRMGSGFLIKRAGARMTKLKEDEVVFVKEIGEETIYCAGGIPSSESRMHLEIYENRKDANIVLHFHDKRLIEKDWNGIEIGPFEYGTKELAEAVGKASKKESIIKIKEHGFVIIAKNEKELIKKIKEAY